MAPTVDSRRSSNLRFLSPEGRRLTTPAVADRGATAGVAVSRSAPDPGARVGAVRTARAACRNRTDDLFITSESLYRLS